MLATRNRKTWTWPTDPYQIALKIMLTTHYRPGDARQAVRSWFRETQMAVPPGVLPEAVEQAMLETELSLIQQQQVAKGDKPGHRFRGNQHTGGIGGMSTAQFRKAMQPLMDKATGMLRGNLVNEDTLMTTPEGQQLTDTLMQLGNAIEERAASKLGLDEARSRLEAAKKANDQAKLDMNRAELDAYERAMRAKGKNELADKLVADKPISVDWWMQENNVHPNTRQLFTDKATVDPAYRKAVDRYYVETAGELRMANIELSHINDKMADNRVAALKELRPDYGSVKLTHKSDSPELQRAIDEVGPLIPASWARKINDSVPFTTDMDPTVKVPSGGHGKPAGYYGGGAIHVRTGNGDATTSVVVHEIAHANEYRFSRAESAFWLSRDPGAQKWQDGVSNPLWGSTYAANAIYGTPLSSSLEILSVGSEILVKGGYHNADPGHIAWTLGALAVA